MAIDPKHVKEIFLEAAELSEDAARAAYLDKACGGDAGLRARVEALLRVHDPEGSFLGAPAAVVPDPDPALVGPASQPVRDGLGSPSYADDSATQALTGTPDPGVSAVQTTDGENGASDDEALSFLAPPTRPDSLGRIGHYEVLQVLGRGGFGIVFRAFDEMLQRVVALKVMAPQLAATSPARKRFLREARSSAQVRHENVVQVYEVAEQPLPYLAMEFIPGETLQQRLDRVGPLDVPEVLRIGRQIAEGLAAAHAMDLIHRDIKPGNVLLEGGQHKVKITDFGLARTADDASISQSGIIAGTPMYMAPEQALGQTLDQRADLFSLGSVLYQMVAGRPPFRANSAVAVLKRVAEDTPRAIREIIPEAPPWLCDIIAKLHAKNPDDRYQSAREVADVLADCEAQLKTNARLKDYSRIPRNKRRPGRRNWVAVALAALLVALAFAGTWFGRAAVLYFSDRGELELLPEAGLVDVIVLQNNEGVLDGDKLHAPVTDWLDMKKSHTLKLPPGQYQLNVGTWPASTHVSQWEVTTSGPLGSNEVTVPVINGSAILTVERGRRVTLRAKMRTEPQRPAASINTPFDAKQTQQALAKQWGIPVERINSIGMKLRLIPAGKFTMGSSQEEIDRCLKQLEGADLWVKKTLATEGPEHLVEITQPFYLGATEVTVGQFRQFVDEQGYQVGDGRWRNPGFDQTDQHPVVWVSWHNAVDFCKWLSKKEGKEYRLPTEAEWEYSCRAGKAGRRYCFGDDDAQLEEYAWYATNSQAGGTHPVGKKKPNAWGLYGMHGNAWEWCQEKYDPDYYKNSPVKDPPGPSTGGARVARGGSWPYAPVYSRSAFRGYFAPDGRIGWGGFRVLLVSPPAGVGTESGTKNKPAVPEIAPFTDADVQRIAALPVALQVEEVRKELIRRNPRFDGKMEHTIKDGVVTEFRIVTDQVTDIAPIRAFNALRVLDCHPGLLADLTPLEGMHLAELKVLDLRDTKVSDAGMVYFKDCKHLTYLILANTKVTERGLAHFKGCKNLTYLDLNDTPLGDAGLAHFKDCKNLSMLYLTNTKVSDAGLAQFKGMPLKKLFIDNTAITDLTLLQGMPLEEIRLTPKNIIQGLDILRHMKSLKTIGIAWDQAWPAAEFWKRYDKGEFKK